MNDLHKGGGFLSGAGPPHLYQWYWFHCGGCKELSLALATHGSLTCFLQMTCALLQIGQTKCKPCSIVWTIVWTSMPRGKD